MRPGVDDAGQVLDLAKQLALLVLRAMNDRDALVVDNRGVQDRIALGLAGDAGVEDRAEPGVSAQRRVHVRRRGTDHVVGAMKDGVLELYGAGFCLLHAETDERGHVPSAQQDHDHHHERGHAGNLLGFDRQ